MTDHIVRFDCLLPRIFAVGIYSTERQQPSQRRGSAAAFSNSRAFVGKDVKNVPFETDFPYFFQSVRNLRLVLIAAKERLNFRIG